MDGRISRVQQSTVFCRLQRTFALPERVPGYFALGNEAIDAAAAARSRPPPTPRRLIAHLQRPMLGRPESGARAPPPPPVVRLQSSHATLLAVDRLEAEGRYLEAAELLAERLQQIQAAANPHSAGSAGRLRRAWSAMASAWSVLRGYEEPPML